MLKKIRTQRLTSNEIFGQFEASRMHRFGHVKDISRMVSSVTHKQDDMFSDVNKGHDIADDRIAVSGNLWQEDKSNTRNWGQLSKT